jgi:hypothetical protein
MRSERSEPDPCAISNSAGLLKKGQMLGATD